MIDWISFALGFVTTNAFVYVWLWYKISKML